MNDIFLNYVKTSGQKFHGVFSITSLNKIPARLSNHLAQDKQPERKNKYVITASNNLQDGVFAI